LCRGFFDPHYAKLASKQRWIKKSERQRCAINARSFRRLLKSLTGSQ
jgi:hypothetical protein